MCALQSSIKDTRAMITNKGRVYFSLRGNDFNPDSLTELIGVAPTNIIYEGTKLKNTTRKFSSWELSTDEICSEVIDVYDLSDEIVKQLDLIPKEKVEPDIQMEEPLKNTLKSLED